MNLTLNAGDSACTAPGSTPSNINTSAGGLSGRIYANLLADVTNGLSSPLSGTQTATLKSLCTQMALAIMQELAADNLGPTAISYQNGFSDWGSPFATGIYWKDPFNRVGALALAKAPSGGSTAVIMTFPAGYRPRGVIQFMSTMFTGAANVAQTLNVDPSGAVYANGASVPSGGNISLACISFLAEQ